MSDVGLPQSLVTDLIRKGLVRRPDRAVSVPLASARQRGTGSRALGYQPTKRALRRDAKEMSRRRSWARKGWLAL